jgi:hypothetical protein
MHALLVELFPWLVALWVLDGLAQLGRGHLLFVRGAGGRFGVRRTGLHLVGLSPLDEAVAAHDLPFLASPTRVFLFDPRRRSEPALVGAADLEAVRRDGLAPVEREGRKVRAAGRVVAVAPTAEWAGRLREDLAALAGEGGPVPDRLDLAAARALRERQRTFLLPLRAAASLLFATAFVAWPAAAYAPGAAPLAPEAVLAVAGALVLVVAGLTFAMLAACGEPPARGAAAALHLVVFPVAALRPLVHGPRSLYRRFDALTVAAALLPPERFGALAARELRRARLSRDATALELAAAWDERGRGVLRLLAAAGIAEAEALAPPARVAEAAAWCPLCGGQYRAGFERCADCGVAAEPFAP